MYKIKTFLHKSALPATVFLTGACVLIIEVVATRMLSPYFGNTIFTVSSVISVVLAALSVGYYIGGKLADKRPDPKIFYGIIAAGGIGVLCLQLLYITVFPWIAMQVSLVEGPLITSCVLFFIPSFLLGMLSPFAIKLQVLQFPKLGIGTVSGEIFFWSTLGSIAGSLLGGFVLIPYLGITVIVIAVGAFLTVLGTVPLVRLGLGRPAKIKLVAIAVLATIATIVAVPNSTSFVFAKDGVYEKIVIFDGMLNGQPTRFFQQDRSHAGAMYLNSDELVYDYTKYYAIYRVFRPQVNRALAIGGGAYSVPKALLADSATAQIDVVEIEPSLFELAKQYLRVPDDTRLKNYTEDGRRFLHDASQPYDLIFSDVYFSLYSIPAHFTTKEFFKLAQSKLSKDGVFIANLIGDLSPKAPSLILSEIKTFQLAFPNSYFFAVQSPDLTTAQNIIFVGYNSDKKIDFSDPKHRVHANSLIHTLPEQLINIKQYDFSQHQIITDDFAPVEHLTARVLEQQNARRNN